MEENQYEKIYKRTIEQVKRKERISPLTAIRLKCLDCTCYQSEEVRLCPADDCILWAFRFGHNESGKRGHSKLEISRS